MPFPTRAADPRPDLQHLPNGGRAVNPAGTQGLGRLVFGVNPVPRGRRGTGRRGLSYAGDSRHVMDAARPATERRREITRGDDNSKNLGPGSEP